jgi:hypothetical protein
MNLTTHLPLDVKNKSSYNSAPLYTFMVWTETTLTLTLPNSQGIEDFNPYPANVENMMSS